MIKKRSNRNVSVTTWKAKVIGDTREWKEMKRWKMESVTQIRCKRESTWHQKVQSLDSEREDSVYEPLHVVSSQAGQPVYKLVLHATSE